MSAAGVSHDSPRAQTCTFEGPGLQSHHQISTKRPPREEERMKIVAGEGKNIEMEGSGERPNFGRTHENFEHTPHTTGDPAQGGLGQGVSLARRSMAQKTRHEQQIRKSSAIGQGFLGVWAQNGLIKKGQEAVWAKNGAGQKWCGPTKKHVKNKSKKQKSLSLLSRPKNHSKKIKKTTTKSKNCIMVKERKSK